MTITHPQGVVILGSTGSIGRSTLDVIEALPDRFRVVGLAAGSNQRLLEEQVKRHLPEFVAIRDNVQLDGAANLVTGADALTQLATLDGADIVVVATTGHTAIEPTIAALERGKIVALANKETIVAAGELVMAAARAGPGELRPVDSEHSAIWQCVGSIGTRPVGLRRLILTASGGPFRDRRRDELTNVTPAQALRHPNWNMGPKVTIDSATLMNKGLELIEASWLFDTSPSDVDVLLHPQSIVHSLVEYEDGALMAQLGPHDMRLPIQLALTWPERVAGPSPRLSVADFDRLDFAEPDHVTFPSIRLAREAARRGSTFPTVLSTADEIAVAAFLSERIGFLDIADVIERVLMAHDPPSGALSIDTIAGADRWARDRTLSEIDRLN